MKFNLVLSSSQLSTIKFQIIFLSRWFSILFKKNKKMEIVNFSFNRNWLSDKSFLFIHFKFNNAIYYRVGNIKSENLETPIILNLQNLEFDKINFEVYGFNSKRIIEIVLNKELDLNSLAFCTTIKEIVPIQIVNKDFRLTNRKEVLNSIRPKFNISNLRLNVGAVNIKTNKILLK